MIGSTLIGDARVGLVIRAHAFNLNAPGSTSY
jgi:hypothetical protein